jgi:hypothetical protein
MPIVNLNQCIDWKLKNDSQNHYSKIMIDPRNMIEVNIIKKHAFNIYGIVYECAKSIVKKQTFENFFGAIYEQNSIEIVDLVPEECNMMINSRKCNNNNMNCVEDNGMVSCEHQPKINNTYRWLSTIYHEATHCFIKSRKVAQNHEQIESCDVKNNFCKLRHSVLVWNENIYKNCNFELINSKIVKNLGDELYQETNTSHIFKIINQEETNNYCNKSTVFKSAEGLYLNIKNKHNDLPKNERYNAIELAEYNHLMLSELDGNKYDNLKQQNKLSLKNCETMMLALEALKNKENSYQIIKDVLKNKTYVIFIKNSILFIPRCRVVNSIDIINGESIHEKNEEKKCYTDLKIKIKNNNKRLFLSENNIIKNQSKERNCEDTILRIVNNNKLIMEQNNNVNIMNVETIQVDTIDNRIEQINFPHFKELINQHELAQIKITDEIIDNLSQDKIQVENINSTFEIKNIKTVNVLKKLANLIILTIIICSAVIILVLGVICCIPNLKLKTRRMIRSITNNRICNDEFMKTIEIELKNMYKKDEEIQPESF